MPLFLAAWVRGRPKALHGARRVRLSLSFNPRGAPLRSDAQPSCAPTSWIFVLQAEHERHDLGRAAPPANPLLAAPILPTLVWLTLPNTVAMLATALVAIAETSYIGRLGTVPLAAMALVFPMVMLTQMMSAGAMGGGVSSAISRALGSGDVERAQALALHAGLIGLAAGLTFTAFFLLLGPAIYRLLGGHNDALREAVAYSNMVFSGAVAIWLVEHARLRHPRHRQHDRAVRDAAGGCGAADRRRRDVGSRSRPVPAARNAGVAIGQVGAFACGAVALFAFLRSGRGG